MPVTTNGHDVHSELTAVLTPMEQERNRLAVTGRSLTEEEQRRLSQLNRLAPLIRNALDVITEAETGLQPAPVPEAVVATLRDGRYDGGNGEVALELRVDGAGSGVISADLFRVDTAGRQYVASMRTAPGMRVNLGDGRWPIVGQDEDSRKSTGTLTLTRQSPQTDTLVGILHFEAPLTGLPVRRDLSFVVERTSDSLRHVGIEMEIEDDVEPPKPRTFGDREITIETALADAGIETYVAGMASKIPSNPNGWDNAQLHALMKDVAQASLLRRAWDLHLLILSRSTDQGLLGIMFDTTDPLPRQGAAVFASEIRGIQGIDHERKLIQTTIHELGHALNLAHRFERTVGRSDSTSFMNYDWRFKGGSRRDEFWSKFRYTFDADELEFLRHGPLAPLIPGGEPFHSINYWADGSGGYAPYLPEVPIADFKLVLKPPQSGPLFTFAQPVFLEVELTNQTGRPLDMPSFLLDPKAGFLEILIRRHTGQSSRGIDGARSFIPVVQRCFDRGVAHADRVQPGGSMTNNLNLTYGSGGFSFAEPGTYEVTAVLAIMDESNNRELVVRSQPLRIRVATPKSNLEEKDALDLLRDDVGLYLALGGSSALPKVADRLDEVVNRRREKMGTSDPVTASIIRAKAIDAQRPYIRLIDGKFKRQAENPNEAAKLLKSLDDKALENFDSTTITGTRQLLSKIHNTAG